MISVLIKMSVSPGWNPRLLINRIDELKDLQSHQACVDTTWLQDLSDRSLVMLRTLWNSDLAVSTYFESPDGPWRKLLKRMAGVEEVQVEETPEIIGLLKPVLEDSQFHKYQNSPLDGDQKTEIMERVKRVIQEQKPHLSEGISLSSLAEMIEVHPHYLSQVINELTGDNFSALINQYRIEHVLTQLIPEKLQLLTIAGIGREAGFHSRSAFYKAFKRFTGMTPGQYLSTNNLKAAS